jgi:hypothetical protein
MLLGPDIGYWRWQEAGKAVNFLSKWIDEERNDL